MASRPFRVALANLPFPASASASVMAAEAAVLEAGEKGAKVVCFPEAFVPGYRAPGKRVAPPDAAFLEDAWTRLGLAAAKAKISVVLGTERVTRQGLVLSALVLKPDGSRAGFQDKVQIDVSEEATYVAGTGRRVFEAGGVVFGVAICHEGWRYPETVRWAARNGAQVVFHPHFHEAEPGGFRPSEFADPRNSFHEKAILCRAAENSCFVASVNCASPGSPTTSVVARPDGSVQAFQPYGKAGLLVADLDLQTATRLLAMRLKPTPLG